MPASTPDKTAADPASGRSSREAIDRVRDLVGLVEDASDAGVGAAESATSNVGELPDPVVRPNGEPYYPRRIGEHTDVELLATAREQGIYPLLAGYPGGGKTALLEAAFGGELITVNCDADTEVSDLIGTYVPTDTPGVYHWVDGPAVIAAREGKVLFLDDATIAPPGVLAKIYPLLDGRGRLTITQHEGEEVTAADGFFVVAAHNPGVAGAMLSEALSSRFLLHLNVETDLVLARRLGVDPKIVKIAGRLIKQRNAGALSWAPEMRELLAFKRISEIYGNDIAASNLISVSPESDRDVVASEVRERFPGAAALSLGPSAT